MRLMAGRVRTYSHCAAAATELALRYFMIVLYVEGHSLAVPAIQVARYPLKLC